MTDTSDILALYFETGSYKEVSEQTGLSYDAVRKRVRRNIPPGSSTLFRSEADDGRSQILQWHREPKEGRTPEEVAATVLDTLKAFRPPAIKSGLLKGTKVNKDLLNFVPIADLHLGLRAWDAETKGGDWDLSIAETVLKEKFAQLINQLPEAQIATLVGLGDLLHADNSLNKTMRSNNPLDVDGRYPKILSLAVNLIVWIVYLLKKKHKTVLVRLLPGNHDDHSALAIALAVSCYFTKDTQVEVDSDPGRFWYYQWGRCLLGATHGDQAKMRDFAGVAAYQVPQLWGQTEFRNLFTGHIHQQTGFEKHGATVESLQSPVAPDAWTVGMGFGAGRSLTAITYDKNKGWTKRHREPLSS